MERLRFRGAIASFALDKDEATGPRQPNNHAHSGYDGARGQETAMSLLSEKMAAALLPDRQRPVSILQRALGALDT